ncbi:MAG: 16S rRNA (guanine(527)-N(7))-methyltransferase RsmG [Planctomycetaceae bacterium]|jgi:16S rRNA (guanine527-N7)-methyltransferase|nr:16S rRNA (guanine(527)-N(7))-methyltransferase RsmG [Planctomycetaceae bacterium]
MDSLHESLKHYNISLSKGQIEQLSAYCQLLWEWNGRFNLTRHTTYDRFVSRDLVDSLAIAEFLRQDERVLDVGSGGGVPGIILKILRPDLHVELCDSTGKKSLALSEITNELNLNIAVHHAKVESLLAAGIKPKNKKIARPQHTTAKQEQQPPQEIKRFTTLTIRAVSKLPQLLRMFSSYWTLFDRLLLIKGPNWVSERGEARHYNLVNKLALRVLKTYPTTIESKTTEDNSALVNSVVLQICRKVDFEQLDKIIDNHKINLPQNERTEKRDHYKRHFKKTNPNSTKKTKRKT